MEPKLGPRVMARVLSHVSESEPSGGGERMKGARDKAIAEVVPKGSAAEEGLEPTLDRAIQSRIGHHLRAMYDDLMHQPVPDRFAELLGRLDRGDSEESKR
jgi:hypothetical protein